MENYVVKTKDLCKRYGSKYAVNKVNMNIPHGSVYAQSPAMIAAGIITPIYWAAIFFVAGAYIFTHRDIK